MNTEPRIGLGTNRLTNTPEHVTFIREAVAAGIRHIDTAHLYTGGDSEQAAEAAALFLRQPFLRVVHPPIALRSGGSRLRQLQRALVTGV